MILLFSFFYFFFPTHIPATRSGVGVLLFFFYSSGVSMRMLFYCDFYAFLANLGDYDRAGLSGEGCCAVDGSGRAEGLAIDAIEADRLVVV